MVSTTILALSISLVFVTSEKGVVKGFKMEARSVLVTGANRGIGLEFVKQLSGLPKPPELIFATYRSSSKLEALEEIKNSCKNCEVVLIQMDVSSQKDVVEARKTIEKKVGDHGLNLLINNAGVLDGMPFPNLTEENLLHHYKVNTVGPIRVLQELLPLLKKAAASNASIPGMNAAKAAVINISSLGGSITKTTGEIPVVEYIGYKTSKAALNMAMKSIAAVVKNDNILVVMVCPGWVRTDLGSQRAAISPEESISAMIQTLGNLNESHHGVFMDRHGNPYPF